MKHYIIKTWEMNEENPKLVASFTDRYDAEEDFIHRANRCIYADGSVLVHITHRWNYIFERKDGSQYRLYMYEND